MFFNKVEDKIDNNISNYVTQTLNQKKEIINSQILGLNKGLKLFKGVKVVFNIFNKSIEYKITDDFGIGTTGIHSFIAKNSTGNLAFISKSKRGITATIFYKDKIFNIDPISKNIHLISEIKQARLSCGNTDTKKNNTYYNNINTYTKYSSSQNSKIRILVLYTPSASANFSDIKAIITNAKNATNEAFQLSRANAQIELAYVGVVDYNESGNALLDVNRLMGKNDGYMDEIHTLRTEYEADICALIVNNLDACGRVPDDAILANYNNAFLVVKANCAVNNFSFAHEIGHLLGCRHNNDEQTFPEVYAHGYQGWWKINGTERYYRTIMSVIIPEKYKRINFFSNPDIFDENGIPLGTYSINNNAAVITKYAPTIANFEPLFKANISGPLKLNTNEDGIYKCTITGGTPPFHYQWQIMKIDDVQIRALPANYWFNVGYDNPIFTKPVPNNGDFRDFKIRCIVTDNSNNKVISNQIITTYEGLSLLKENDIELSKSVTDKIFSTSLNGNFPNPFNPTTKINFSLQKPSFVTIKVYNIQGKELTTLVNEHKTPGNYSIVFDGSNLSSGIYIYKMTAGNKIFAKKMFLIK